jgi:hypothetical protein
MLTKADDYPIHQTPDPIAYSGTDRNFYDRYFFNGYSSADGPFFAAALGVYPHLNVMDAAFSIIDGDKQHNLHASKRLHMERLDTRVGAIEVEVIEPLRVLCLRVDSPEHGISAELTFTGRFAAIEEPRFVRRAGSQTGMDYTRLTQNGTWQGHFTINGTRHEVTPEQWQGTRDRSWGIRPVGMRDPQPNPEAGPPQFFWLWSPMNFPQAACFYHLNADASGDPWNTMGRWVTADAAIELNSVSSQLSYQPGTRWAAAARIAGVAADGRELEVKLTPRQTFFMRGIGYGHPEWGHGLLHGELEQAYEVYDLNAIAAADPGYFHIQAICDGEARFGDTESHGIAILEQLVIGPYTPYGFKDLVDLAS